MESIRAAAWVGTWALVWGPIRELCEEFKTVDITAVSTDNFTQLSIFTELQDAHASLLTRHAYVEGTHEEYDRKVYDFCKEGLAHFRFHPANLPERSTLLPLARFDSNTLFCTCTCTCTCACTHVHACEHMHMHMTCHMHM